MGTLEDKIFELQELLRAYESLLRVRDRIFVADDRLASCLFRLYVIMSAHAIRQQLVGLVDVNNAPAHEHDHERGSEWVVPEREMLREAGKELFFAVAATDGSRALEALRKMGVPSLFSTTQEAFSDMESLTSSVRSRAQQILWVELALFAIQQSDYDLAGEYVRRARSFDLRSLDSYSAYVVEGILAVSTGNIADAIRCLVQSMDSCLTDVEALRQCSVLAPNLGLVEKLLERGERIEVLRHLAGCQDVWERYRSQIDEWIIFIENGKVPQFDALAGMDATSSLSSRLRIQWLRACSLESEPHSTKSKVQLSPTQVLAARKKRFSRPDPGIDAFIRRKLEYLENDIRDESNSLPPDDGQSNRTE